MTRLYVLITKSEDDNSLGSVHVWGVYTLARATEERAKHLSEGLYTKDEIRINKVEMDFSHTVDPDLVDLN